MNIHTPTEDHPVSPYVMLPLDAHQAFLERLLGWINKNGEARVFDLLEADNHYVASFYNHGNVMERALALENMSLNARFVKNILTNKTNLHVPGALVESFKVPDLNTMLFDGFDEAFQSMAKMLDSAKWVDQFDPSGFYAIFLLRPHETLNHAHAIATQLLTSDCPVITIETADACAPALKWLKPDPGPRKWINPTGRNFVRDWVQQLVAIRGNSAAKIREILQIKEDLSRHI